jgi:sigma-E factor negative regulatory protein RseA
MNEKLSSLMDGELDRDDARGVIRQLGQDDHYREQWDTYHLIGEVLRGDANVTAESASARRKRSDAIFAKLALEPTVFAPAAANAGNAVDAKGNNTSNGKISQKTRIAVAMAASVVTLSAIVVVAIKQQSGGTVSSPQLVQQVSPKPLLIPASNEANPAEMRVNDYLAIHRQFAGQEFQTAANRNATNVSGNAGVNAPRERVAGQ